MEPINIKDLKKRKEDRISKAMADIILDCAQIDKDAYSQAADQAAAIMGSLMDSEVPFITICIGKEWLRLDIIHTDVLNQVYVMLESMMALGQEE